MKNFYVIKDDGFSKLYTKKEFNIVQEYIKENPQMVEKILTHYLEEVKNMQSPKVITSTGGGGIPLSAPPNPTTLDEARELAKKLFN